MQIAILCVGTELTTGQILNKNAQWISQKMMALGTPVVQQICVPDDRPLVFEALEHLKNHDVLFITGGLGPTSDDFTREVVADWSKLPLEFHNESWAFVQSQLASRGVQARDLQKQQCYFPKGARVLTNRMGTANGFELKLNRQQIYCLPGPPREIDAIWTDFIAAELLEKTKNLDQAQVYSREILGIGESDIAHTIGQALPDCPFEIGYRVHYPYVEIKLNYRKSQSQQAKAVMRILDKALQQNIVAIDGADLAAELIEKLATYKNVLISDSVSQGYLFQRLLSKKVPQGLQLRLENTQVADWRGDCHLSLEPAGEKRAFARFNGRQQEILSPYKSAAMSEREMQYFSEMALLFWARS